MSLTLKAPAKINLRLEVLGKRPDGYHEVRMLMVAISVYDTLRLEKIERGIRLSCPGLPEGPENLAWKAADAFFRATGVKGGIAISLEKYIPSAAGLGGGSSDAATVLEGLDQLYQTGVGTARLREIGATLGSDIPFFFGGAAPAWATGRGEIITPLEADLAPVGVVLINPGIPVSTPEVYRALSAPPLDEKALTALRRESIDTRLPASLIGAEGREFLRNDLERVVFTRYPVIERIKERLLEAGASAALMSGSGSSVFGLCSDGESAQRVINAAKFPEEYFSVAAQTLTARL